MGWRDGDVGHSYEDFDLPLFSRSLIPSDNLIDHHTPHPPMNTFKAYMLKKAYQRYQKLGDRLAKIEPLIDWDAFTPIIQGLYHNKTPRGGRPNMDPVVMVKLLVLQQWYGLSDPELERQATDRISFQRFLGFPEVLPDYSTVWQFRERLAESGNRLTSPISLTKSSAR